jgi:hypothetical protein
MDNIIPNDLNSLVIGHQMVPTVAIWPNTGQIPGLPANPKYTDERGYNDLRNSLLEDPEYLNARPLIVIPFADQYVVICGNGRHKMCVELTILEVPCVILNPNTPVEKLKRYMVKDNVNYGKWDWDMLANDFEVEELAHFGIDVPYYGEPDDEGDLVVDEKEENFKLTLECGNNKTLYEQLKLKLAPIIEELEKQGLEIRG